MSFWNLPPAVLKMVQCVLASFSCCVVFFHGPLCGKISYLCFIQIMYLNLLYFLVGAGACLSQPVEQNLDASIDMHMLE